MSSPPGSRGSARRRANLKKETDEKLEDNIEKPKLNPIDEALIGEGKYGEDDEFFRKFAGPVLLGPFIIALYSVVVIFVGQLILNSKTGVCGYPLQDYISAQIATCYLFLLIFSWVYLGDRISITISSLGIYDFTILVPFQSLKWIMAAYALIIVMTFIIGIVGAFLLSLSTFCKGTAPKLYQFSLFLVITTWLGLFITAIYIVSILFGNKIQQYVQEQTKVETVEEVEERLFRKKFAVYDTEKNNKIKSRDLNGVLESLGVYVPAEEQKQLAITLDPEQEGFITLDVFLEWFKDLNSKANDKVGDDDDDDDDEDRRIFG